MRSIQGRGVSDGLAQGPLVFFRRAEVRPVQTAGKEPAEERARFLRAQAACVRELEELAGMHTGEAALLLETHAMLAEDEDFIACILACMERGDCAESAVQQAGEQFAALFFNMDDPYMRERAADVTDVARRLLCILTGQEERSFVLTAPAILCADDLSPSETLGLDRSFLLGFLTREGSKASHTAILARTLGIPAVCGLGADLPEEDGLLCCLDGGEGTVVLDPDEAFLTRWAERTARQREERARCEAVRGLEDVSPDGRRVDILCNIGTPADLPAVLDGDGRGIGLLRSEFLFLGRKTPPGEEEQLAAYKSVTAAMGDKPVVIRTMDLGADKQAAFLPVEVEPNPALGLRGVRLCLERPELFRTQLRALYRASAFGNVSVMFPMIASAWEVRECRRVCGEVMDELEREGIPFRRETPLGIMIETPAAALMAEELAWEADFFCLGTNDLTQYVLACDRQAGHLDRYRDPRHPAVLRAVRMAAEGARAAGIPVSICGDLAGDAGLLSEFLAWGIGALSVPPARVLPLRWALRGLSQTSPHMTGKQEETI